MIKVEYKNNKHIYFRLNNDLSIWITCPSNTNIEIIKDYLSQYIDKIEKKYQIDEYLNVKYDLNNGYLYLLGKKYNYQVTLGNGNYLKEKDNKLNVFIKNENELKNVIDDYLLKEAKKYLKIK